MTTFVNNDVQSGNIIYAADHNEQGARVAAVLNGGIDSGNIADGAVTTAKITNKAATLAKINGGTTAGVLTTDASGNVTANAQQAWQSPTFQNGWINYGSSFETAGYMKDELGFVHLKGMVKNGTAGAAIFTLPVGYRPAADVYSLNANGGSSPYVGIVAVTSAGVVKNDTGTNAYQSLDNVIFKAA